MAETNRSDDEVRRTVTVRQAAKAYGISGSQAYELAKRGELPGAIRLGGRIVVSKDVMERTLNPEPLTGG